MQRLLTSKLRRQQNNYCRSIQRTAVYGPVRTVVWEGRGREAPPYPDSIGLGTPVETVPCGLARPRSPRAH